MGLLPVVSARNLSSVSRRSTEVVSFTTVDKACSTSRLIRVSASPTICSEISRPRPATCSATRVLNADSVRRSAAVAASVCRCCCCSNWVQARFAPVASRRHSSIWHGPGWISAMLSKRATPPGSKTVC